METEGDGKKMRSLTGEDYALIEAAQKAIRLNYDEENENHTVGSAVRCKNGNLYVGVNVYSLHGACAEQIAIGTAITHGERSFETIVAVRGKNGEEISGETGGAGEHRETIGNGAMLRKRFVWEIRLK